MGVSHTGNMCLSVLAHARAHMLAFVPSSMTLILHQQNSYVAEICNFFYF